jgi:hypothetical protein
MRRIKNPCERDKSGRTSASRRNWSGHRADQGQVQADRHQGGLAGLEC